jgi:hypothetical protein
MKLNLGLPLWAFLSGGGLKSYEVTYKEIVKPPRAWNEDIMVLMGNQGLSEEDIGSREKLSNR